MATESPKDIFTSDEFAALCQADRTRKFPDRRNTALNKGGSVDIFTDATGTVLAVVRYATITDEVRAEVAPLLAAARA